MTDPDVGVGDAKDRLQEFCACLVKAGNDSAYAATTRGDLASHVPSVVNRRISLVKDACNDMPEHLADLRHSDWNSHGEARLVIKYGRWVLRLKCSGELLLMSARRNWRALADEFLHFGA